MARFYKVSNPIPKVEPPQVARCYNAAQQHATDKWYMVSCLCNVKTDLIPDKPFQILKYSFLPSKSCSLYWYHSKRIWACLNPRYALVESFVLKYILLHCNSWVFLKIALTGVRAYSSTSLKQMQSLTRDRSYITPLGREGNHENAYVWSRTMWEEEVVWWYMQKGIPFHNSSFYTLLVAFIFTLIVNRHQTWPLSIQTDLNFPEFFMKLQK